MEKKILISLLIASFVLFGMTGCQKEDSTTKEPVQEEQIQGESKEELQKEQIPSTKENEEAADIQESSTLTCSLCEEEKICAVYTAEGVEYIVCPDCANEFRTAFAETADKQICSGCEEERICGVYVVEGKEYVVCPDDYEEFAHGMGLIEDSNMTSDAEADSQIETEQNNISSYDDYMASITKQSDILKTSLEQEILTQQDMNLKSEELYELWDDALNYLWGKLKESLPEDEFSKLLDEQRIWISEKEKNVEEAGRDVEGGSMYSLVVNMEAAKITEERVYELYQLFK